MTRRSATIARPIPVCADESVHDRASLAALVGKYDAVNIKLDKTGGLTEALAMAAEAERLGFGLMVGCMVATSLSMAPAMLVAQRARVVDLDGPLLLARDREHGLRYEDSLVYPATPELCGAERDAVKRSASSANTAARRAPAPPSPRRRWLPLSAIEHAGERRGRRHHQAVGGRDVALRGGAAPSGAFWLRIHHGAEVRRAERGAVQQLQQHHARRPAD